MLTVSHQERYEARVDAQRAQLFETAATQTAKRLRDLGWERIVLVSERQVATRFREALPGEISELGMKALDEAQAESSLSEEEEASQLAYDELRALRQERRGAA